MLNCFKKASKTPNEIQENIHCSSPYVGLHKDDLFGIAETYAPTVGTATHSVW